jgi:hypothetical protein
MNRIGSTKIGRGLVGAGGELGLCSRGSRCALAAFILHCKKYMNSYMITAKIYEFIRNMNSYLYEFIYWVAAKIGIKFKPHLFRLYLDRI